MSKHATPTGGIPSEGDGVFAVGMAAMLILPLLFAVCTAWCCFRSRSHANDSLSGKQQQSSCELRAGSDSSDGEEAALWPDRSDDEEQMPETPNQPWRRGAADMALTSVYFRKADWCGCARRPLMARIKLGQPSSLKVSAALLGSHTSKLSLLIPLISNALQELYSTLHQAHRQATLKKDGGSMGESRDDGSFNMTVEYRDKRGQLAQVTSAAHLKDLVRIKALYVTISVAPLIVCDQSSIPLSDRDSVTRGCKTPQAPSETNQSSDDEQLDNSSDVLIDLSLAGCCGVQSTLGGLTVTGGGTGGCRATTPSSRRIARPHRQAHSVRAVSHR